MAVNILDNSAIETDPILANIVGALEAYLVDHPKARIDVYRQDEFTVRVRVVDPTFTKVKRYDRLPIVWKYLLDTPNDDASDVFGTICLTPAEARDPLKSRDFAPTSLAERKVA